MSLAYSMDKTGRLEVAFEAMDKVSIFKSYGVWMWWCPCCRAGLRYPAYQSALRTALNHVVAFHPEDED